MTYSHYSKSVEQIRHKPGKLAKFTKYNIPKKRRFGENTKRCKRCMRTGGHISKYGLGLCRQCFREVGTKIGFKKFG